MRITFSILGLTGLLASLVLETSLPTRADGPVKPMSKTLKTVVFAAGCV
jgi:hypothetical protein